MDRNDRYDSLIKYYATANELSWRLIKKLIEVESSFRPDAVSPVGAVGLAQFMPRTWTEWGNGFRKNPEESIRACCLYLKWLYGRYAEIPDEVERLRFALAAYNCGRANLNRALHKARKAFGQPASFKAWQDIGSPTGSWQKWHFTRDFLQKITGENSIETIDYVEKILPYGGAKIYERRDF